MSTQVNAPNSDQDAATPNAALASKNNQNKPKVQKNPHRIQVIWYKFIASFLGAGFFIPILLLVMTVGFYIAIYGQFTQLPNIDNWISLLGGLLSTIVIWLFITFFYYFFATAKKANSGSYEQLVRGLIDLEVHLGLDPSFPEKILTPDQMKNVVHKKTLTPDQMKNAAHMDTTSGARNVIALQKAHAYQKELKNLLTDPVESVGFQWVMGTGYINAWGVLHRAQEALIEIGPIEEVLRGAMHDKRSIQGSNIPDEKLLLDRLAKAVKSLDPQSIGYFGEDRDIEVVPSLNGHSVKHFKILGQIATTLKQQLGIEIDLDKDNLYKKPTRLIDTDAMHRARVALREIRQVVNGFRDTTWDRLLRGRNRLMGATLLMGLITYTMLCITLLTNIPYSTIFATAVFYTAGAVTGLFGQFYREATNPTTVDDFGLSLVRLIATPLLSGLAGLGGVFISAVLTLVNNQINNQPSNPSINPPTNSSELLAIIFTLTAENLLIAAIFGLTPSLIIKSLQQRAAQYADDLQNSKGSSL